MNLKSEKLYIDETDHVEKRGERSEEARQKAIAEQSEISERVQKLEAEKDSNAMASLTEQQRLYGLLFLLASVLFLADCPIQYGLNSVAFAKLSWFVLIIISVLVAAGLGVVVEVAAFAMFFDPYRPRRTVRLCLTSAGISGGMAAAAGTILLFSRTATGGVVDFLAQAVPVSLWVLGESLPVAAGFLSAAAWTLGYPTRRDGQIDSLKARLSELGRFLDWLDRDKRKVVGSTVTMLLLGVVLLGSVFSTGAFAAPVGAAKVDGQSTNTIQAPTDRCLIYVDMTESVDPEFRRQAVARVVDTLPNLIAAFHCTVVGVGTFADEGPFSPLTEVPVAQPPAPEDCSKATYKVEGLQKITDNVSGFQDYYYRRAQSACQTRIYDQSVVFRRNSQEALSRITSTLSNDLPPRGRCTAISGLLSRAVKRATAVVLVTDGLETCDRGSDPIRLPPNKSLVFVLLPYRGPIRETGRVAQRVESEWRRRVPSIQVVMPSDITPQLWNELVSHKP